MKPRSSFKHVTSLVWLEGMDISNLPLSLFWMLKLLQAWKERPLKSAVYTCVFSLLATSRADTMQALSDEAF